MVVAFDDCTVQGTPATLTVTALFNVLNRKRLSYSHLSLADRVQTYGKFVPVMVNVVPPPVPPRIGLIDVTFAVRFVRYVKTTV